jgi:hypothetical protein
MNSETKDRAVRAAAAERAREYRLQADAFRRLAAVEPLEQRRRLLALSASKYDQTAESEERVAYGARRDERYWPGQEAAFRLRGDLTPRH